MSASENKDIVRRYWEGRFNDKDYSVVDEFSLHLTRGPRGLRSKGHG